MATASYTYGDVPAYGYTQLPRTQGGRMALGIFADDTWQVGRATLNLGVRHERQQAYFAAQRTSSTPEATRLGSSRRPWTKSSGERVVA
ncbi:MAG: hypothetical protein R2712_04320 [Vicinamibacterales bacterium]